MAGLSLDSRVNAKRLYAVAKPSDAFRFDAVHDQGPCSFHAFDLPLSASSKPVWSVDMRPVQAAFEAQHGVRPYGNGQYCLQGLKTTFPSLLLLTSLSSSLQLQLRRLKIRRATRTSSLLLVPLPLPRLHLMEAL